jgi:hypothetical protein
MPAWLTLMIIVLVAIALFADHRRSSLEDMSHTAGHEKLPSPTPDSLIRPNVRDGNQNGHPASVPRPLTSRRAARGVRKQR